MCFVWLESRLYCIGLGQFDTNWISEPFLVSWDLFSDVVRGIEAKEGYRRRGRVPVPAYGLL